MQETPQTQPDALFFRAIAAYQAKDIEGARTLCAEALRHAPSHFAARYLNGLTAWRLGNVEVGRRLIKDATKTFPKIAAFDHMTALLRRQGVRDEVAFFEVRLFEFLKFNQTENFLISYPKCGRTWVRLVLGVYALNGREGDPLELDRLTAELPELSSVRVSHDDYPHWKPYTDIHKDKSMYAGKRVALMVRDPRDVVVSYYFQYTRRGDRKGANDADFSGSMSDFVHHPIGGIRSIVAFYNAWAAGRTVPDGFLLVPYEDVHANPSTTFRGLIDFFGWPDNGEQALASAISFGSFDNMKKLEAQNALNSVRLRRPTDGDPESFKVRRGIVGGYRDYLTADDITFIDAYLDAELDDYYARYKSAPD